MGGTSKPHWEPTHQAYLALWLPFSFFRRTHLSLFLSFSYRTTKYQSWLKTWRMQCCCGFEARPWKSRGLLNSRGRYHKISNHTASSISQTWQGIAFQVRRGTLSGIAKAVQCQSCHLCLCHEFSVTVTKYVLVMKFEQPSFDSLSCISMNLRKKTELITTHVREQISLD